MKNIIESFKKWARRVVAPAAVGVALSVCASASAQNISYYYSSALLNTNIVIAGAATTNFVLANYPATGAYVSTKGITANDVNAIGYTLQVVTVQVTTNTAQYVTNATLTFAPILDDYSLSVGRYPAATNNTFTATVNCSGSTNAYTYLATIAATNTLGAKQFKLVSALYNGTNQLNILSARVGYWY
jgi:hypothetical protein